MKGLRWLLLLPVVLLAVSCGGRGASGVARIKALSLRANALLFVPQRGRLYASVPGSAGVNGNSIAVIEPATWAVESYIFVGSEPNKLAVSDDGTTLYVGLDGAGAVRRVDLLTNIAGIQWSLGGGGPARIANIIDVMPGLPNTVVVSCNNPNTSIAVVATVFDDGIARPQSSGFGEYPGLCRFNGNGTKLFAYSSFTSPGLLYMYDVDANGLTLALEQWGWGPTFVPTMLSYAGKIYFGNGQVYDVETAELLGTYAGLPNDTRIALSAAENRAVAASGSTLWTFGLDDYVLLSTQPLNPQFGSSQDVAAMGEFGEAVATNLGNVLKVLR